MILKNIVTAVFFVETFGHVLAASYSNVYFLGKNGVPVDIGAYPSSQVQQAPLTFVPITSLVAPCPAPCINPNNPVSNAKLIAYDPPSKPLDDGTSNYGYSYVIFDDGTGDKKALSEISDGENVRGQYSVIQPDGVVREVQYTSDDLKGLKSLVRNLLDEKVISLVDENKTTEDAAPIALIDKSNKILGSENQSKDVPSIPTTGAKSGQETIFSLVKGQDPSSSVNALGKEEQSAEVKEIKPLESGPPQETFVNAAVEEIKPKSGAPSDEVTFHAYANVIKCIQESMKKSESPLVYIILPSKTCA